MISIILVLLSSSALASQSDRSKGPIIVLYANEWAPISEGNGKQVRGILPGLIEEIIQKRLGIDVIHKGVPWGRAQEEIERGTADAFVTTPTPTRKKYAIPSDQNVLYVPFEAFVRKGSSAENSLKSGRPLTALKNTGFCDLLGNGWAVEFYRARKIDYQIAPTIDSCLNMLSRGRTDIVIHATPVTQLFIKKLGFTNEIVRISHVYSESPKFPLLISKKSKFGADFLERFDQTLADMKKTSEYDDLLQELTTQYLEHF
ncbi:substrate-binding periplasmic protein [Sneathiella aquimaris]|uniref:substrate-binding periplasmic protein n=1 Tax=Sneathiella aquimaris TaxID=2599305 RepID=UPI00146DCFBA|nr:transporter substrate-binding domain-containing protein [Sneathiella aquimaris]